MTDTISWAFNFIPWWVWIIIVVVPLAVFWQALLPIWLALPKWLKGLIIGAGALLTAYVAGRNRGAKDERDMEAKRSATAIKTRKETDDEVRNLSPSDTDKRLDRWFRD